MYLSGFRVESAIWYCSPNTSYTWRRQNSGWNVAHACWAGLQAPQPLTLGLYTLAKVACQRSTSGRAAHRAARLSTQGCRLLQALCKPTQLVAACRIGRRDSQDCATQPVRIRVKSDFVYKV